MTALLTPTPSGTAPAALAAVLRSAADEIGRLGLWRGGPFDPAGGPQPTCIVNAIGDAARRYSAGSYAEMFTVKEAGFAAAATYLGLSTEDRYMVAELIDWNDHTESDDPQAMVCATLHAAADLVLQGGAS